MTLSLFYLEVNVDYLCGTLKTFYKGSQPVTTSAGVISAQIDMSELERKSSLSLSLSLSLFLLPTV